jgi:hypothetical protein
MRAQEGLPSSKPKPTPRPERIRRALLQKFDAHLTAHQSEAAMCKDFAVVFILVTTFRKQVLEFVDQLNVRNIGRNVATEALEAKVAELEARLSLKFAGTGVARLRSPSQHDGSRQHLGSNSPCVERRLLGRLFSVNGHGEVDWTSALQANAERDERRFTGRQNPVSDIWRQGSAHPTIEPVPVAQDGSIRDLGHSKERVPDGD